MQEKYLYVPTFRYIYQIAKTMDDIITRQIHFAWNGKKHSLLATQRIEANKYFLRVRFTFEPNGSGIEYVIGDNSDGFLRLVDSNGETHHSNPLYQEILHWFQELEHVWLHVRD